MTATAATASDLAAQPDLTRARARAAATFNAVTCLFCLVLSLVEHGRNLASTFRDHVREPGHGLTGRCFGTSNIYVIGTCMRRGLMRGIALREMLRRRADRGPRLRMPAPRRDRTTPAHDGAHMSDGANTHAGANAHAGANTHTGANAHAGAEAQDTEPARPARSKWWQARNLAYLPTEAEVADEARRRRPGAIAADICLDFGMTPDNAGELWDALLVGIDRFGGSRSQFIAEVDRRRAPASRVETPRSEAPPEHHRPDALSAEERSRDVAPPQAASAECSMPEAAPRAAAGQAFALTATAPEPWPVALPPMREVAATAPA